MLKRALKQNDNSRDSMQMLELLLPTKFLFDRRIISKLSLQTSQVAKHFSSGGDVKPLKLQTFWIPSFILPGTKYIKKNTMNALNLLVTHRNRRNVNGNERTKAERQ